MFVSRSPWFGKRNHIALLFSKGIAKLEQSGIYNRWERHYYLFNVIIKLIKVNKRLNNNRRNYFGFVVMAASKSESKSSEAEPLGWNVLYSFFWMWSLYWCSWSHTSTGIDCKKSIK